MSMNLNLYDQVSGCDCHLYQTPTADTYRILEGKDKEEVFKNYIAWLMEYRKDGRKLLRKADLDDIKEHEERVRRFLDGHPSCQFGAL
jgi:hypothetical protein